MLTAGAHCCCPLLVLTAGAHCWCPLLVLTAAAHCCCPLLVLTAGAQCWWSLLVLLFPPFRLLEASGIRNDDDDYFKVPSRSSVQWRGRVQVGWLWPVGWHEMWLVAGG